MFRNIFSVYRHTLICAAILLVLSVFGTAMVLVRYLFTSSFSYLFLIWNLFLSWIPFGLSILIAYLFSSIRKKGKYIVLFPLGILWVLFYPNAPYMITDFIHFRSNPGFMIWYDLVIYSVFIFTSFLLGFVSMYLINRVVEKVTNKIFGWLFVLIILFVSSYGIYLGRFIRWNSWDMLFNPLDLLYSAFRNINYQSVIFSIIYGSLLALIYAFLYGLTYLKTEKF